MEEDESTCLARICQVNHGGDNQASYCFQVFKCLTSAQCHTICRTLSIVLLPGLILFGGITIFITGCLINIPPMIIGGAAMFVLGILFCLLCGHACDGLTKRVRKPRHSRDETKPVLVWFQIAGFFFFFIVAWQYWTTCNWWHPFKWRGLQTQANQPVELCSGVSSVTLQSNVQLFSAPAVCGDSHATQWKWLWGTSHSNSNNSKMTTTLTIVSSHKKHSN